MGARKKSLADSAETGICLGCGTAELTGGRPVCQACGMTRVIAADPAAPAAFPPAVTDRSGTRPCGLCGEAPCGRGGVLCPGCKDAITARDAA